ncbi:Auxin-induced protein 5NG4 [Hordeum vulgare]|nr:Auxin-induced protein 5NG4 [Hordeum vulgare]
MGARDSRLIPGGRPDVRDEGVELLVRVGRAATLVAKWSDRARQAALGTAAKYWLNLYAVEKRGPVFPAMFSTLSTVFTMILGTLLLGESLTVGSLLGSAFVFGGLYIYLYGKANEQRAKAASVTGMQKEEDKEIMRSAVAALQATPHSLQSATTEQRPHPVLLESSVIQFDEELGAGVSK